MSAMNPTCYFTGKKENLLMYAHRNANGDMVGWVFVHNDVEMEGKDLYLQLVDPPIRYGRKKPTGKRKQRKC